MAHVDGGYFDVWPLPLLVDGNLEGSTGGRGAGGAGGGIGVGGALAGACGRAAAGWGTGASGVLCSDVGLLFLTRRRTLFLRRTRPLQKRIR